MVLVDNIGFHTGSFSWKNFGVVAGQNPTFTTGSDEDMPILFVDYVAAWNHYGVNPTRGGDCPKCSGWGVGFTNRELHINPRSRYWFLQCPVCLRFFRYLDNNENLDDLEVVKSKKTTEYDENVDTPMYIIY